MAQRSPPRLYAITLNDALLRFPAWQFTMTGIVPSLEQLLAVPQFTENPIKVSRFMYFPNSELENTAGEYMSPRDCLISGFDVQPILDEAKSLAAVQQRINP